MTLLQAIVLGLIQGATEFAPISSSGHLILVPWLLGWPGLGDSDLDKAFDVALHLGTLVGALCYFRHDVARYLSALVGSIERRGIGSTDERIAWAIVVGTVPGLVVGVTIEGLIKGPLGAPWLIATSLALFGVLLWWVDRRMPSRRSLRSITPRTGLGLGLAQALALQPGVSRSGVTLTAARMLTLDREAAARISFLLSLPIIAGAGLYEGVSLGVAGLQDHLPQFLAGFAASAVSGFIAVWGLLRYLRRHGFAVFMFFRIAVALIAGAAIVTGFRSPSG